MYRNVAVLLFINAMLLFIIASQLLMHVYIIVLLTTVTIIKQSVPSRVPPLQYMRKYKDGH